MPKQPLQQRFRISCEVDVGLLGPAMVALAHIHGLVVTGNELITDVPKFKQRNAPEITAESFLRSWLADHPTFTPKDVVSACRADGRTPGAGYTALAVLVQKGDVKKLGPGAYARADVKQLTGPKKKQTQVHRDVDHATFMLRAASRNHSRFNTSWMKAQFEKDGRVPGNVSPTVAKLIKLKQIKRVGDSEYVLLAKAATKKPKKPASKKVNGAAPVIAEVTAHG